MPSSRVRIPPRYNGRYALVRAMLYNAESPNPTSVSVQTRVANDRRTPLVEEAFSGVDTQPRIHDITVTIRRGGRSHQFQVFLKNHKFLPVNAAILALVPGRQWHGDILIMRFGSTVNGVVNLRTGDAALIRYTLRRLLQTAQQGERLVLPSDPEL